VDVDAEAASMAVGDGTTNARSLLNLLPAAAAATAATFLQQPFLVCFVTLAWRLLQEA
jgi:hypothetical protein